MPAGIEFTDESSVLRFLTSSRPSPANHLRGFLADAMPIGPARHVLADAALHRERFRTDRMATFAIEGLTADQLEIAQLCKLHFENGGTGTLYTDDAAGRTYAIRKAPDTSISISGPDEDYEYTYSMTALNTGSSPMVCVYETAVF